MPEYLAPGVYVEETSFRAKSNEGVGTSTTAFVGPTRKGPIATADGTAKPEMLTSFGDFSRIYGGLEPLDFAPGKPNYLANAVLGFFNEGGCRLYVARVANAATKAVSRLAGADGDAARVHLRARYAGAAGNGRILVQEQLTPAMKKAMVAAGLREPTFAPDTFFRATFYRSPEFAMKGGAAGSEKKFGEEFGDRSEKSSEKILAFLALHDAASAREVAQALGLTSRAVEKQIATLKAAGSLRRVGPDKGGHWDVSNKGGKG